VSLALVGLRTGPHAESGTLMLPIVERQAALKRCLTAEDGRPGTALDRTAPGTALPPDGRLGGDGNRRLLRYLAVHRPLTDYFPGQ